MSETVDRFVVILDANVMHPFGVRDALLRFAEAGLYRARWSEDILDEMERSIVSRKPALKAQMPHLREAMALAFPEAVVEGYESLIPSLDLPDEDDRHVLAAAIRAGAQLIVTENLKDFPDDALRPYDVEPLGADNFLTSTFELHPSQALAALRIMRRAYDNPAMSPSDFLLYLRRNGLVKLSALVRPDIDSL